MVIFEESAPAKINLTLDVLGRRTDGYHELRSLVAFARDAADHISLDTSRPAGSTVAGPFGATIAGKNLIDVTLAKLSAADPQLTLGHVTLTKNLPVAAGIGGGSADAAAVLRAVRRANPKRVDHVNWHAIALSLGADVPVCLLSQTAMMGGIGDRIEAAGPLPPVALVLVNPLGPVPADKTAQVFKRLKAPPLASSDHPTPLVVPRLDDMSSLFGYMTEHGNDLEHSALEVVPEITAIKRLLSQTAAVELVRLSGGGPTCFAIYATCEDAERAGALISSRHPSWWVHASRIV
ncbi:MAG: 4-(cytidine 5'-diphospho)-2-C-methyl-D-erythritol kinase [Hyphomicrobium sp.]